MRRFITVLTALVMTLLALPAAAHAAAAEPLGSGTVLFNPQGASNQRCTVSFAATDGKEDGYLVAGPTCTGGTLYSQVDGAFVLVGQVIGSAVPYDGWVVVRVTNTVDWELVPWVLAGNTTITITGSVETPVGGKVCHVGPTIGQRCGSVDAVDQTVTFPWGTVTGVTRTSICSGSRDLGAAYLTDDQAQGIPLGGPDFCTTGASYFLPINPILDAFGLKLVTG